MKSNKIFHLREEHLLTQQHLANIIGGSQVNISNWENDKEFPNIQKINKIADHFHISLDYLFNLSNNKRYPHSKQGIIDKQVAGQRLKKFRQQHHLTLRKLAEELNTTSSTISAYETGKTLILTAFAIQICRKYKISMDWLYGKTNK